MKIHRYARTAMAQQPHFFSHSVMITAIAVLVLLNVVYVLPVAAGSDANKLVSQSEYPTTDPGKSVDIWMTMRNSGSNTWSMNGRNGYGYRGTGQWSNRQGNLWKDVRPGENLTLRETVRVPDQAGTYTYGIILRRNGRDFGLHFFIQVTVNQLTVKTYQSPIRGQIKIGDYRPGVGDHTGRDNYAVDFMGSDNLDVYPTRPGKVVFSGYNCETKDSSCYGNVVAIDHGDGVYSIYTHLANDNKGKPLGLPNLGTNVGYNTRIGIMSDTGCSGCGIHLHFAVRKGRKGLTGRDALWLSNEPVNIWREIPELIPYNVK